MGKNTVKKELEVKLTSSITGVLASYNNKEAQEKVKKLIRSAAKSIGKKFAKTLQKEKPVKKSVNTPKNRAKVSGKRK